MREQRGEVHDLTIPDDWRGLRLDKALARLLPDYSRSRLQAWLTDGAITVDGGLLAPKTPVRGGERVRAELRLEPHDTRVTPETIPLHIRHEDTAILVLDKPAGLVVHPGAGNRSGTLQNALLHHDPELAALPRAGIVHRLDKDTSGLLVVARTLTAHKTLVAALAARSVTREYQAVVNGVLIAGGEVDAPIGRHPVDRKRMAVLASGRGRPARTHYRVIARYRAHSHLRLNLDSGRTHQIRVHLRHIRHPLAGDLVYGGRLAIPAGASEALAAALRGFRRQALHASRLALAHPVSGEALEFHLPPPADFQGLLAALAQDAAENAATTGAKHG